MTSVSSLGVRWAVCAPAACRLLTPGAADDLEPCARRDAGRSLSLAGTGGEIPTWDVKHELACHLPTGGPVDDARCDVEAVEQANSEQLYAILHELTNTSYFRLMQINMEGKCKFAATLQPEKKCNKTLPPVDGDSEDVQGGGGPKTKKSCDLDLSGGGKVKVPPVNKPPSGLLGGFQPPSAPIVKTITQEEQNALNVQKECNDPTLADYWLDMCRTIPTNSSDYINLQLNPERWTGYNGSHVWSALYDENCFSKPLDDMCYEERVLYRLLSGMHASINIHISESYYPPAKGKRAEWEPNLDRFMRHFGANPERLKNLHFAFVVLLRSVQRAAPYLYNHPFLVGDAEEERRTAQLMQVCVYLFMCVCISLSLSLPLSSLSPPPCACVCVSANRR